MKDYGIGNRDLCLKMIVEIDDMFKREEAMPIEAFVVLNSLTITELAKMKPLEREACIRTAAVSLQAIRGELSPKPKPRRWFSFFGD